MKNELKRKVVSLSITLIIVIFAIIKNNINTTTLEIVETNNTTLALESKLEYNLDEEIDNFIKENETTINFFSKTFGISVDNLKQEMINNNKGKIFNSKDSLNLGVEVSLDKQLTIYLSYLEKEKPELFKRDNNNGNDYTKEYVYALISYFANIYDVDFSTLAGIAYIESGNLNAKYMMSCNNVYGGMSSSGLIKHENIEYGIFRFVSLVANRYVAKGLTTPELIGSKYAPGNDTWAAKVNVAKKKFIDYEQKTNLEDILNLR